MTADTMASLQAAQIVAEVRLEEAKRKAEMDKEADDKEWQAIQAFNTAYHAWLAARARIEEPDVADDEQPERYRAESETQTHSCRNR